MEVVNGRVRVQGVRTNSYSGEITSSEIEYVVRTGFDGKLWFFIISGGVTGYESFPFSEEAIQRVSKVGWWACAGTPKRWDSLLIPGPQINIAVDDIVMQLFKRDRGKHLETLKTTEEKA